ncbi:transmembrane protein 272 isoform X2 [Cryptotermes secundus]|uniref:transmembrane protein 272 isoform X2 n=1 Tax=Cryptotermes secundus TaxID=105785 RepID=UPI000CD7B4F2|nr:transmembrane protein 272 isoform X2 [Cryptotermes secundus]
MSMIFILWLVVNSGRGNKFSWHIDKTKCGNKMRDFVLQSPGVASDPILQCQSEPQSQGSMPPPSYHSVPGTVVAHTSSDRGAPPSYDEAIDPHVGCSIVLGVTIVIPICMIAMGSIYLYDCPQGEYIPIYLLIGGIFGILKQLLDLSAKVRQREEEQEEERIRQSPTQTVINCFMLGWFIIGSVWVYKEYEPNYDPTRGKYCNRTLYLFAFWLITSVYVVLGVITLCLCCISAASVAVERDV